MATCNYTDKYASVNSVDPDQEGILIWVCSFTFCQNVFDWSKHEEYSA